MRERRTQTKREIYHGHIIEFIQERQKEEFEIELGMDANEPLGVTKYRLYLLMQQSGLRDAHANKYGQQIPSMYS